MERFSERAVVLSTLDYGDADRMVTLFTAGRGKLTAFAAGARKSKRRFAGALEPCTLVRAQLVERRGTTYRLDSVDVERSHAGLRSELALIARALYCAELCRELVRDDQPHPELFERLVGYLAELEGGAAGPTSLLAFELDALAMVGLMPRLDACAACGGPLADGARFDPESGGAVCALCAAARAPASAAAPRPVLDGLARIQRGEKVPLGAEARQRARELLNLFISHHLGRRLRSVDFMAQVGTD